MNINTESLRRNAQAVLCFFGRHDLRKDDRPTNGVWWAFCRHCAARYGGEYDPFTGETQWRPR